MRKKDPGYQPKLQSQQTVVSNADYMSNPVLTDQEVIKKRARHEQIALSLVPLALKVIAETIRFGSDRLKLSAAVEICKMSGVARMCNVGPATAAIDQEVAEKRYHGMFTVINTFLEKSEIYEFAPPQEFVDRIRDIYKRTEALYAKFGTEEDEIAKDKEWKQKHRSRERPKPN